MNIAAFEYAGFWRRLGAVLIDVFLVAMVLAAGVLGWIALTEQTPEWGSRFLNVWITGTVIIALLLKVVLDAKLQGTPGLHLVDCRIVDARSGHGIGIGKSIKRNLGIIVSILPALLGLVWIVWDKRKQGFHDKLAGTVVIRDDDALKSLTELAQESS